MSDVLGFQSAAVLRREAEQFYEELGGLCVCQLPENAIWCESCQARIDKVMAFARRQRAQVLRDAAEFLEGEADDDAGTLASAMELRRRAAAEGTET